VSFSEHYILCPEQQVDSGIVGLVECVTENIIWKVLHSKWTVVLWVEWIVIQRKLYGRYRTAGEQFYCGFNVVCYSEHYVEGIAQQMDSGIVG